LALNDERLLEVFGRTYKPIIGPVATDWIHPCR
jgi:hypothetical protein